MSGCFTKTLISSEVPLVLEQMKYQMKAYIFLNSMIYVKQVKMVFIGKCEFLSLYSTRTQNTWRRGLALGNAPDARILGWGYQHVGI